MKSRHQTTPGVIFYQTTFNLINQGVSISTTTIFHLYNPVIRLVIIATIVDIYIDISIYIDIDIVIVITLSVPTDMHIS